MSDQQPYQGGFVQPPAFTPQVFTPQSFTPEDAVPAPPPPISARPQVQPHVQQHRPDPSQMSDDELRSHVEASAAQRAEAFRVPSQPAYEALAQPAAAPTQPVVWSQQPVIRPTEAQDLGPLIWGAFAGLGVGLAIGLLYAVVTAMARHDYFAFVVLIGAGVGVTLQMVAKRSDIVTGAVSAVLTVVAVLFAEYLALTLFLADAVGGLGRALALASPQRVLEVYLGSPVSLLWLAGAVIVGFFSGARLRR